jgi:hypothetical protein
MACGARQGLMPHNASSTRKPSESSQSILRAFYCYLHASHSFYLMAYLCTYATCEGKVYHEQSDSMATHQ